MEKIKLANAEEVAETVEKLPDAMKHQVFASGSDDLGWELSLTSEASDYLAKLTSKND